MSSPFDFLLASNNNLHHISHRFRDRTDNWSFGQIFAVDTGCSV